ncbi:unnamed protein product [Rotaria sp. Silwood1]|nr:unnamed protein product [Rotaria sp. Silwood1]CAF1628611.1 unnamed protein product [Rotaria sp. Silwood1]CAF3791498.1 unnamed protein product [Rotaria sp. Silwood1]
MQSESSSSEEQVTDGDDDDDDDVDSQVWGEIESESEPEFSENYGMMEEVLANSNTIQELITIAKKIYIVTLFPYDYEKLNIHYLQIELIQDKISIIININFFNGYNIVLPEIDELLSVIFPLSKSIQVLDTSDRFSYGHGFNLIYSPHNMQNCHFVNIQNLFEIWYNNTFQHNENCGQLLDYNQIDGPLCTCSYRPLKFPSDQWSLKDAIAYAFQENLNHTNFLLYE